MIAQNSFLVNPAPFLEDLFIGSYEPLGGFAFDKNSHRKTVLGNGAGSIPILNYLAYIKQNSR